MSTSNYGSLVITMTDHKLVVLKLKKKKKTIIESSRALRNDPDASATPLVSSLQIFLSQLFSYVKLSTDVLIH